MHSVLHANRSLALYSRHWVQCRQSDSENLHYVSELRVLFRWPRFGSSDNDSFVHVAPDIPSLFKSFLDSLPFSPSTWVSPTSSVSTLASDIDEEFEVFPEVPPASCCCFRIYINRITKSFEMVRRCKYLINGGLKWINWSKKNHHIL